MIALLPELLKAVPWIGMVIAALYAYLKHNAATTATAKADARVAQANQTVADIQNATAQSNAKVASDTVQAVQDATVIATEVKSMDDDAVRKELQNDFGRKD